MKTAYLLDTDICIYIIKQKPPDVLKKFQELKVGQVAMSIITFGELKYGAEKSQQSAKAFSLLDKLSNTIPPLPLPVEASEYYGKTRATLQKNGTIIGNNDLWIAAHALAENLTLVTNNTREFSRINKLKIENWVSG